MQNTKKQPEKNKFPKIQIDINTNLITISQTGFSKLFYYIKYQIDKIIKDIEYLD